MHIDAHTAKFGIIGHPIGHSLSPNLHNSAFAAINFPGIYLAFDVQDVALALQSASALGFKGLSVTIPHKVAVLEYIQHIDPLARNIGAVNTVIRDEQNGGWKGYNSDGWGAMQAIMRHEQRYHGGRALFENIIILGNGGAARAIAFYLCQDYRESQISLCGRDHGKLSVLGQSLERQFAREIGLTKIDQQCAKSFQAYDLVINTTPVGMHPYSQHSPIPQSWLVSSQTVFDTIYNPRQTKLLEYAQKNGAKVIEGLEMLLYQAVFQFEKFTGKQAPVEVMRESLVSALR